MTSIPDNRKRMVAAVEVDRLFDAYRIQMEPDEAFWFGRQAPEAGVFPSKLYTVIKDINDAIPLTDFGEGHPKTGKHHHHYWVGRDRGNRILIIEIFKGFFQAGYDFTALLKIIHVLGTHAGARVSMEADNNSYAIEMLWPQGGPP